MKVKYDIPSMLIIGWESEDVITTSSQVNPGEFTEGGEDQSDWPF